MPKLSNIQKADQTKTVSIDFGDGEVVSVTCYPNRMTGKRRRELQDLGSDTDEMTDEEIERYTELYFDVFKEWDITDDKDVVLPFDENTIEELSIPTTIRLFTEIVEAANPNRKTSARSRKH